MKGIHIFSPDIDRKLGWYGSVVFMILAWLFLTSLLIWVIVGVVRKWPKYGVHTMGWEGYLFVAVYFFVLVMIPVQLARYFRNKNPPR